MTMPAKPVNDVARATAVQATGFEGSNQPMRLVGATTFGPPTSSTYRIGDVVISHDGEVHICIVGGSPGTWASTVRDGASSFVLNGHTISASGGNLFIDGNRLAKASKLGHTHGQYALSASDPADVDHTH